MSTLAELLTTQTAEQIFQSLLTVYQAAGFPVTAWQVGGVERTRLMAIATGLADVSGNYVPAIAGGSLLDYAPNYPGWTALTAEQIYNLEQNPATFTLGNITAVSTASGAYNFTAGQLKITFGVSGRSYINTGAGTIPASGGGSLVIPVRAEFSGADYVEPSNTASASLLLTSPLPGVTLTNPASNYSDVTHTGSGTGTLTLGGTPVGNHTLVITVTSTGQSGVGTWSYSLDGAAAVSAGAVASLTNIGGFGIDVTLVNGAVNPSFVINDTYTFTTPGSWITSQGSDVETDTVLAERCRDRWSSLSLIQTGSYYELLAMSEPTVGSQVTQVTVQPDATINNKVNIVVSGPGGVLPGATITALQAWISPRSIGGDNPVVQSPTTLAITIAATITVPAAQYTTASAAITTALQNYIAGIGTNGTIRIADIIGLVVDVDGIVDCTGVTINAVAANLTLGSTTTYVLPVYPPTLTLAYVTT